MTDVRETYDAMTAEDRRNLVALDRWLDPHRERQDGEYLIGPEYTRLRMAGVIAAPFMSAAEGKPVVITDLGRAVLPYIEGGQ